MRYRLLGALALLYGVTFVHADYYRFIYTPGAPSKDKDIADPKNPNVPPGAVQPGFPNPMQPSVQPGFRPPFGPGTGMPKDKDKDAKPPDLDDEVDLTASRLVIIEVTKHKPFRGMVLIKHKYGMTALHPTDDIKFKRVLEGNKVVRTVAERYDLKHKELLRDKLNKNPEKIHDQADFALTRGLYTNYYDSKIPKENDKFRTEMDDLLEVNPKNPSAIAYKKVLDGFKKTPTRDPSSAWKDRLSGFKLLTIPEAPHYTCLYNAHDTEPVEVHNRLKRLETNYQAFFYYFALKGIALPQPDHKLMVVFADTASDFKLLHKAFDSPPLTADGFIAHRENVVVISLTSLDEYYNSLNESTSSLWKSGGWNKENLLRGIFKSDQTNEDTAAAQESALLLKAMQDESDLMTCTNLGSRQLAAATGLLSPLVVSPQWVQCGLGSFFETPKGAYWPGTSMPHWRYLPLFLNRRAKKVDKPEDLLMGTVTDHFFREARASNNDLAAWEKANTMAWALTYFLLQDQNQRERYLSYLQELNNLPRDMDLTEDVYAACFARAFNLLDRRDPSKIDTAAVQKLAREWYYNYMTEGPTIDVPDLWAVMHKLDKQRIAKAEAEAEAKKNPDKVRPGQYPAGYPMPPGGFRPGTGKAVMPQPGNPGRVRDK